MEQWRLIKGYEGYQVSNLGRVKAIAIKNYKERILKQTLKANRSYKVILFKKHLSEKEKGKSFAVHRLVAEAFIRNPKNKPEINHIDGNSFNNIVTNLEWSTNQENIHHSRHISKNGTVISLKKIKALYFNNKSMSLSDFIHLLVVNCK